MGELGELKTHGEPGAMVYLADCVRLMRLMPAGCVDAVFADPPYRLSNGGVTVRAGKLASVDKGEWDRSLGFGKDHEFNLEWLGEARRILKPDGTLWVTGTHHVIFSLGFALQTLGYRIINDVIWSKPDPPPNARHTTFTHDEAVVVHQKRPNVVLLGLGMPERGAGGSMGRMLGMSLALMDVVFTVHDKPGGVRRSPERGTRSAYLSKNGATDGLLEAVGDRRSG